MATTKAKPPPVGSAQWIQSERAQAADFVRQEGEEFSFSVRNEMDWLNEHMSDVFTKTQMNFADIFKTPGKLRGKTPRTTQKRTVLAPRQPLLDVFAPNPQQSAPSPVQKTAFYDKVAHFQIAEDVENKAPEPGPISRAKSPLRAGKLYTDSGYHGMTEDEMDVDIPTASIDASSQETGAQTAPIPEDHPVPQRIVDGRGEETGASDDSFVSAKEQESDSATVADTDEHMADAPAPPGYVDNMDEADKQGKKVTIASPAKEGAPSHEKQQERDSEMDPENASQSDVSSAEKPLQRKSSFTFSALPARPPLGGKRSMGQTDGLRSSALGRSFGARGADDDQDENSADLPEKSAETKLHNKTSTQLLHERITMLGKTKEPRSSKSIPPNVVTAQPGYPQLPTDERKIADAAGSPVTRSAYPSDDEEDDWIPPAAPAQAVVKMADAETSAASPQDEVPPIRPAMHQKSLSAAQIPSPKADMGAESRHAKAMSISHPNIAEALKSTTPASSPTGKSRGGPLSASKNRLWSALSSAKKIFASSASASAAAKLEAHNNSPSASHSPKRDISGDSQTIAAVYNMPGALYSEKHLVQSPSRPISVISLSPSRKTRSSSESNRKREKEAKEQQKAAEQLEKAREKERQAASKQQEERVKAERAEAERQEKAKQLASAQTLRPESAGSDRSRDMPPPPPPKAGLMSSGKLRAPGRLMRPTKEVPNAPRPAPVSIRVTTLSKSQHESSAPLPPAKDTMARSTSSQSLRSGSAAPPNAPVKALEVAARKREADEKAAQKKAEQKKELERKRAARAEKEKRAEEERKAEEQRRLQESKLAAQRKAEKLAAEAKRREQERLEQQRREQERAEQQKREQERRDQQRLEQQRREQDRIDQQRREAEQQRQQEEARRAREAHDLAEAIRRERAQQALAHTRGDAPGTLRQLAKSVTQIHMNPSKPAKRQLPEESDAPANLSRPGIQRGPPSYQQTDAKRRRTNEDQDEPNVRTSVMAPPKRPSTMRKETLSKYPHGYTHAPPPTAHSSMFKTAVTSQPQIQHKIGHPSQTVQISTARIPFAENPNPAPAAVAPPTTASYQAFASSIHSYENSHVPNTASKYKTPARPAQAAPKSAPKSTPSHKAGDHIELPDIATDSEDEESDDEDAPGGFRAPSWVASPALRDLLTQQQLVDPETVFGPIGELKMDEVFKNSKNQERLKRFRDRGSSALWVESGDAVTSAEKRRDREARERVVREGGWRYELPGGSGGNGA